MAEQIPSRIGRYRILGVTDHWSEWIYRGRDEARGRDVLIVVCPSRGLSRRRSAFERDLNITASLDHPNIVRVFESGRDAGSLYMAVEALEGEGLRHALNAGIGLCVSIPIIAQVLDGLAYLHGAGIVHCNITPATIFIQHNGPVKILDFTGARLKTDTPTGFIMGTPAYMSPEQALGDKVDGRSDLFSTGAVLYELITGKTPFEGSSITALLDKLKTEEPEMRPVPDGPEWQRLRGVITRALQKKPEDRYPGAGAMRTDLELALKELGKSADWSPPPSGSPAAPQFH